ncbi:hypothetical protein [uncultured Rheinheimera sp.]|uniref:hypothetical protein n=1 Tax=uncultured Rheinheimera sp. TaxID=400532 RepID=UPI002595BD04|nr:hypothetical protein [uncultured Rheinheimera sp.]
MDFFTSTRFYFDKFSGKNFLSIKSLLFIYALTFNSLSYAHNKQSSEVHVYVPQTTQEASKHKGELELLRRIETMDQVIKQQEATIQRLKSDISDVAKKKVDAGMSFEVFAGIMLTGASLLLTIVGVGIALLSIFGYKKIMNLASNLAQEKATQVATKTSQETMQQAVTEQLIFLVEKGKFDPIISTAVEAFAYRGMAPLPDIDIKEE